MVENYNRFAADAGSTAAVMDDNLPLPERRLIELRIEHADLDSLIDQAGQSSPLDDLALRAA